MKIGEEKRRLRNFQSTTRSVILLPPYILGPTSRPLQGETTQEGIVRIDQYRRTGIESSARGIPFMLGMASRGLLFFTSSPWTMTDCLIHLVPHSLLRFITHTPVTTVWACPAEQPAGVHKKVQKSQPFFFPSLASLAFFVCSCHY